MIENDDKEINTELIRVSENTRIEISNCAVEIELPSFDEIMQIKEIGFNHINIVTHGISTIDTTEIIQVEKNDFEEYFEKLKDSEIYLYRLSTFYESLGNFEKAVELLKKCTDISSQVFLKTKYAELLLKNNNNDGASILEEIKDEDSCINLSLYYMQRRDFDKSICYAKYAYEKFDIGIRISSTYSLILFLNKEYYKSIAVIKELLSELDAPSYAYYLLSLNYFVLHQYEKAYKNIRIAYSLNKLNRDIILLYCDMNELMKTEANSIPALERYLEKDGTDVAIWQRLAKYKYNTGHFEDAKKTYQAIIAFNDKLDWAWNNLAIIYARQKDYPKSHKYYAQALLLSDNDIIILNYFNFLFDLKLYPSIIELFDKYCSNKGSDFTELRFNIFECYILSLKNEKRHEEYIEQLHYAFGFYKYNNQVKNNLLNYIVCYYCSEGKDKSKGMEYLYKLEISLTEREINKKSYIKTLNNIAFAYMEFNDVENAEQFIKKLIPYLDKNPYYNATYGLYYLRIHNLIKGESFYSKAMGYTIDKEIKKLLAHKRDYELGKLYLFEGMKSNAITFLKKASDGTDFIAKEAGQVLLDLQ